MFEFLRKHNGATLYKNRIPGLTEDSYGIKGQDEDEYVTHIPAITKSVWDNSMESRLSMVEYGSTVSIEEAFSSQPIPFMAFDESFTILYLFDVDNGSIWTGDHGEYNRICDSFGEFVNDYLSEVQLPEFGDKILQLLANRDSIALREVDIGELKRWRYGDEQLTALHCAVMNGMRDSVAYLIEMGFDPTETDAKERDCLHLSCVNKGCFDILKFLTPFFRDQLDKADSNGKSASTYAKNRVDDRSTIWLWHHGSRSEPPTQSQIERNTPFVQFVRDGQFDDDVRK
ncbi:MAG: ankyrin repeat domain-containing protein [Pirellulaceae bacterium]